MYRRSLSSPLASKLSVSMEDRNTGRASSSRKPGTSTLISTQAFWPLPLLSSVSSPSPMSTSSGSSSVGRCRDLSTSALTPTSASVPSSRAMRALPFALGSTSYSARIERKSRGPLVTSRRMGGVCERVERRNDSSAGERLTRACWGAMAIGWWCLGRGDSEVFAARGFLAHLFRRRTSGPGDSAAASLACSPGASYFARQHRALTAGPQEHCTSGLLGPGRHILSQSRGISYILLLIYIPRAMLR